MAINEAPLDFEAAPPASPYAEILAELINNGSIELCDSGVDIPSLPEIVPYRKSIFVPATKRRPLPSIIDTMARLNAVGFDPVPHVAARRLATQAEIALFLKKAVKECGVRRIMLIGGDVSTPAGPFDSARSLLASGLLNECGVKEVAFAGYPDRHPIIDAERLDAELLAKLTLARELGLGASIVTQFSFVPARIVEFCAKLAKTAPRASIYVGVPGPCDPMKLLKYARICGVSASSKMLGDMGFKAVKLALHSDPGEQLGVIARGVASHSLDNVVGVHVFSFGDIYRSARWLREMAGV
ncbi:MAG: hypothetical protein AB7F91_01010 [Parvularculaceae bacterium]|nr:methylenetetrahydrofolate reductase [Parvularculaceae bacterium]